jgi:hypothetical protein
MTPNSAVRDEVACRNAANRSLVSSRLYEFPRLRFTHPKGPSALLPPKAATNTFVEGDPSGFSLGKESATHRAKKYSEPSVRPRGGGRVFSLA